MAGFGICKIGEGMKLIRRQIIAAALIALTGLFSAPLLAVADNVELITNGVWKIVSLDSQSINSSEPPYLAFYDNGKFYAFGECNYFTGSYKVANDGSFLISKMQQSKALCDKNSELEVKMMASLLMSSRMQIQDQQLALYGNLAANPEQSGNAEKTPSVLLETYQQINREQLRKQATEIVHKRKRSSQSTHKNKTTNNHRTQKGKSTSAEQITPQANKPKAKQIANSKTSTPSKTKKQGLASEQGKNL